MDGRGRIAEPLNSSVAHVRHGAAKLMAGWRRLGRRLMKALIEHEPPRGAGFAATAAFFFASIVYGVICGGYVTAAIQELKDARDASANAIGFSITGVSIAGQRQLTREEIFAAMGVTAQSSLLFLDAAAARDSLKKIPWVSDATVLKLYPGRLHIAITEREAFALWQRDGKVAVIAADGTVLETIVAKQFANLPFVVGDGAAKRAKEILAVLDKYPTLREQVYASVLVAERRWNLKLKSGIEVKLPELDPERALDTLLALDREKKLLSRDVVAVDLRLPDRATVRLSEAAAQAREEMLREKEKEQAKNSKRKGGQA